MASPVLVLSNTVVDFGATVLSFDCTVSQGEIVAVAGASGSGKSTLFNVIAGFEQLDSGTVFIEGRDATALEPSQRPVSMVFQDNNLFTHLDIATNIGLGINPALRLTAQERARITEALARVGLAGFEKRRPATLSGGERQRVALARAFVRRQPLLLLDEPFAALDPGLRSEMRQLLRDLHEETGNTILLITHHPDDLVDLADSVLFLNGGRIFAHLPKADFLATDDPATRMFLGATGPRPSADTI